MYVYVYINIFHIIYMAFVSYSQHRVFSKLSSSAQVFRKSSASLPRLFRDAGNLIKHANSGHSGIDS